MQPLCILLPGGSGMAQALWRVIEMGISSAGTTALAVDLYRPRLEPEHINRLLALLHVHLAGPAAQKKSVWLHPRELKEILHILDSGLERISVLGEEEAHHCAQAVSRFLGSIPLARAVPRKPANRIPRTEHVLAASAP